MISSPKYDSSSIIKRHKKTGYPFGNCKVCNDKATGYHYGVQTCEGCKGFYKRSCDRKVKYNCEFGGNCLVTPRNRNRCKACRYQRCIDANMSQERIRMGRIPNALKEEEYLKIHKNSNQPHHSDYEDESVSESENESISLKEQEMILNEIIPALIQLKKSTNYIYERKNDFYITYLIKYACISFYSINKRVIEIKSDNNLTTKQTNNLIILNDLTVLKKNISKAYVKSITNLFGYLRNLPGLDEISCMDISKMFEVHAFTVFTLQHCGLIIGDESYLRLNKSIQLTKIMLEACVGFDNANNFFIICKIFNTLQLTSNELSLLIPMILTRTNTLFSTPQLIHHIHVNFKNALQALFIINGRDCQYLDKINELIDILRSINETGTRYMTVLHYETTAKC